MATLPPAEVSYQESHLYQNETRQLSAFFGVCFVVSFICMTTRVAARVVTGISLKADDAVFLVGAVFFHNLWLSLLRGSLNAANLVTCRPLPRARSLSC